MSKRAAPPPIGSGSGNCGMDEPLLSALTDGELFGDTRETVERHVDGCARCRAIVDDYREWGVAIRGALHDASARDLSGITWPPHSEPIADPAPRALTPRRRVFYDVARWLNPWPVFAGAAVMVALIIGIGLWPAGPSGQRVEIDRLEAAGPVIVLTADGGRTAIIWLSEPEEQVDQEPTHI